MTYSWLHDAQKEFEQRHDSGRLAHACLLAGPRGLGKLELARQMAAALLCQEDANTACGLCRSCQLFVSGAHPDFRLLTFEMNPRNDNLRTELVIEQVRELNAAMQLTHSISPRKVALIHPAECMNHSAANALLKTLEEPAGDAVLILVSDDPSRLPATIRSRCQAIHVRLPDGHSALDWLMSLTRVDREAARIALKASAGSPLLALKMLNDDGLEQFRSVGALLGRVQSNECAIGDVVDTWSVLDQDSLWSWLSLIAAHRVRACFGLAGHESTRKAELTLTPGFTHLARQLAVLQTLADRNRRLMATALRKDLLLRDWLIQWSRLASS